MQDAKRHAEGAEKAWQWLRTAAWPRPRGIDRRRKKREAHYFQGTQWSPKQRASFAVSHGIDSSEVADAKNRGMSRMLDQLGDQIAAVAESTKGMKRTVRG